MKDLEIFKTYGMYSSDEMKSAEDAEREYFAEEGIEPTDEQIYDGVTDHINLWYEDEECNLNRELDGRVLAIASVGRWNGRRTGALILSRNLREVIGNHNKWDEFKVYADRYNVRAIGCHHDGTDYVEYRELREDRNYNKLLKKLYNNEEVSREEINYYTKSLRSKVREIYGR